MSNIIIDISKKLYGPLAPVCSVVYSGISAIEYWYFEKQGFQKPSKEEIEFVNENATVIYKSFDQKNMAK